MDFTLCRLNILLPKGSYTLVRSDHDGSLEIDRVWGSILAKNCEGDHFAEVSRASPCYTLCIHQYSLVYNQLFDRFYLSVVSVACDGMGGTRGNPWILLFHVSAWNYQSSNAWIYISYLGVYYREFIHCVCGFHNFYSDVDIFPVVLVGVKYLGVSLRDTYHHILLSKTPQGRIPRIYMD
jgi:hypothetical protein